ncbi:MAG: chemotaxis protein CheW [Desulfobacterales bacterium]|nr:chemotaxis protein CheW [Desulfobacterales bacterium]
MNIDVTMLEEFIQDSLSLVDEALDQIGSIDVLEQIEMETGSNQIVCHHTGVNAIFRCLHTIKGASGFLGLDALSHFVHIFEGMLKKWQESGKGFNVEEAKKIYEGLKLLQNALIEASDLGFPEKPEFISFLDSLEALTEKGDTISSMEVLFEAIMKELDSKKEQKYAKEIGMIVDEMKNLLASIHSSKKSKNFSISSSSIKQVIVNSVDITNECINVIYAYEIIALNGKSAFDEIDISALSIDLKKIGDNINSKNFLDWEIIKELCDISPEVIDEAFRRLWILGVEPNAEVMYEEAKESYNEDEVNDSKEPYDNKTEEQDKAEDYLRVSSAVIHRMTETTGELVADRNAMENIIQELSSIIPSRYQRYLKDNYTNLDSHVNTIEQELSRLSTRKLNDVFKKLPSMVSHLSQELGKKVKIVISGGEIEIPRELIRALSDPLIHIVRNSMDHGIELPNVRESSGKLKEGLLVIEAKRNDDQLSILIKDDGKGIDADAVYTKALNKGLIHSDEKLKPSDVLNLIFMPGFSTVEKATDVSGRGVGMDVVKTAVEGKGGKIFMTSTKDQGTSIELVLPLSEGHKTQDILLFKIGTLVCGIAYRHLKEILNAGALSFHTFKDNTFFSYRESLIPFVDLGELFGIFSDKSDCDNKGKVMIISDEQKQLIACGVNEVLRRVKVVVNPFEHKFLKDNVYLAGSAVLGIGEPYLIIDFKDVKKFLEK